MRNARFWFHNREGGWVKLTLKPGETLTWGRNDVPHPEEGAVRIRASSRWTHEGERVRAQWRDEWVRCGRYVADSGELVCPFDALNALAVDGLSAPDWNVARRRWRDRPASANGSALQ